MSQATPSTGTAGVDKSAPLLGRAEEQARLDEALSLARSGRGAVTVIAGEPGIGKSALLGYAEARAVGMQVLRARGVQSEAQIPFAGLFELLRPALGLLGELPRPQAEALGGAFALRPAKAEDRLAIGAATLTLLAAYAERSPVLVLVDDAHWLDGSSAGALVFAARRLAADPIAFVVAVRADEPSVLDHADLPRLSLAGLDLAATTELLRRRAPVGADEITDRVAGRLHRETAGNPLALLELAERQALSDETPFDESLPIVTTVAASYARRFDALGDSARLVLILLAASDAGDLAPVGRGAAKLGADLSDIADGEAAGLVDVRGHRAEWRHPLARSAVYASASPAERRAAHRALADALPDADDDRRAWHLALSAIGPDAAASSALEQAGMRARDRSAYEASSHAFERAAALALDARRKSRLLLAASDAVWLGGLGDRAVGLLDEATAHVDEPGLLVAIEHSRGHIAVRRGHISEGRRILLEAAETAATVDPPRAVVMLAEAVDCCFYACDAPTMRVIAERIPVIAEGCTDTRSEFFAAMGEGMASVFSGEGTGGPDAIRRAVAILEQSDELRDDPRLLGWASLGALYLRDTEQGHALVERALARARERSSAGSLPYLLSRVAVHRFGCGEWVEAEANFYEAIDIGRETGQCAELAGALSRMAWLESRTGDDPSCRAHAAEALEFASRLGIRLAEVIALAALGDLEFGLGKLDEALACYEAQLDTLRRYGVHDADLSPAPELVEVYLRLGRPESAEEVGRAFQSEAAEKRLSWALARAARVEGLLAADDAFESAFEKAIELHASTPDTFEAARTHLAYGSRLRRHRQRVRAREELRTAIALFDQLGADPWGEFARAELAATGETAHPRGASAVTQLTPQELQIAVLLADGRTTREAAAALFLSPKTIEYHLRSIYRKLEVSSREGLAHAMRGGAAPGAGPA